MQVPNGALVCVELEISVRSMSVEMRANAVKLRLVDGEKNHYTHLIQSIL